MHRRLEQAGLVAKALNFHGDPGPARSLFQNRSMTYVYSICVYICYVYTYGQASLNLEVYDTPDPHEQFETVMLVILEARTEAPQNFGRPAGMMAYKASAARA